MCSQFIDRQPTIHYLLPLQVCEMDVSKQLQAYEVEYHVLQDELLDTPPTLNQQQRAAQLERTNQSLRQQNLDLLEELQVTNVDVQTQRRGLWGSASLFTPAFPLSAQVSHARIAGLESQVETLARSEGRLREQVCTLEGEKEQLARTVAHLQDLLNSLSIRSPPDGLALPPAPGTLSLEETATSDSVSDPAVHPEGS